MASGLEGVTAADTVLSDVDGARGELIIRGHTLDELAGRVRFEDAVVLLFGGFFADLPDTAGLTLRLGQARADVFDELSAVDETLLRRTPFEALRALTARLADGEDLGTAVRLLAAPAVFTPALMRLARGLAPIAPDPRAAQAADVLRMTGGERADDACAAALDAYLVTVCDHGLNASTFAARVIASTRAGLTSAILGGLSALKGPLHGGAPGPVIQMLNEIGEPANARPWLEAALAKGDRLMGFGHRIYRVRDPRADALKAAIERLGRARGQAPGRLALAEAVERAALDVLREKKPDRSIDTNVEFYTALLLEALAFPPDIFTCVFAMGRTAGWIAHAREQMADGRLIRPQSRYIGARSRVSAPTVPQR